MNSCLFHVDAIYCSVLPPTATILSFIRGSVFINSIDLMSVSRWVSFIQNVKAHWRSWILIKFSFNVLLFTSKFGYNRRIQAVVFSNKLILMNRVISILLSSISVTLSSTLAMNSFLILLWDVSNNRYG